MRWIRECYVVLGGVGYVELRDIVVADAVSQLVQMPTEMLNRFTVLNDMICEALYSMS